MLSRINKNYIQISPGTIIKTLLIILGLFAIYYLRDVFLIVILSIIIASAIEPATLWFIRRGVPRVLSVILIYLAVAVSLALMFYFLFIPLLNESALLLSNLPAYLGELQVWNPLQTNPAISQGGVIDGFTGNFSLEEITNEINNFISNLSHGFFSTASRIFGGILSFILVVALSFYFSVEPNGVVKFLKIVTPFEKEKYVIDLWKRSQRKIGLWMQGHIILVIIITILTYLGLTLLQIENALFLAVLAGLFEIIPLFGPIMASIPAISVALMTDGITSALLVVGLYVIIQQFENHLIYPLVVSKIIGVPPIISILALIIGGKLAGFMGVIIAVPVATILMELFDDMEKNKIKARALSENNS